MLLLYSYVNLKQYVCSNAPLSFRFFVYIVLYVWLGLPQGENKYNMKVLVFIMLRKNNTQSFVEYVFCRLIKQNYGLNATK